MIWNALLLALREIRRNLMRAFLTTLGIVIGVAAVITMVTLGHGATRSIQAQVQSLGSNLLILRPGRGFSAGTGGSNPPDFKLTDAEAIEREIVGVRAVAPSAQRFGSAVFLQQNWSTQATGVTNDYFSVTNWEIAEGRMFSESEQESGRAACIIGDTIRNKLFAGHDPIGQKMRFRSVTCEVVGTLKSKGQGGFGNDQDDVILVPLKTMLRRIWGASSAQEIPTIYLSAKDGYDTDEVSADITALMRQRRNIQSGQLDNFQIVDTKQIAQTLSGTTRILTTLLGAVAAVSMLVGGIGIMNIMLVSVTERTREIGTRLAIGALAREVLLQFLVEAIALSALGGLIGIALALAASISLSNLMKLPFQFDPQINLLAFLFSAAIGVLFGYMPARRAAQLDPIEALRHE
ncbi:ABC transporter permease [Uliginosibacterium sediminicola]|uniref:ABC transporter permease n=1 Tax=Uliginosibacterium sediminicola TaxID=2024550 RepID=A0ABU9Z4G1_9RHOO